MKENKFFIFTLFLVFLSIGFASQHLGATEPDSLQFSIELEKDTFLISEPIWLDMYLRNLGKESISVKPLSIGGGWLELIVINSSNDTLIPYAKEVINFVGGGPTYTLGSSETLYICRDLLEATGLGEREDKWMSWRSYLKPDTYKIKARYQRYLESNELTFAVANPTGTQKIARRMWKEGHAEQLKIQGKSDGSISKWKELIEKYPKSVYAPSALRELLYGDSQNSTNHAQNLLSTHPNSGYSGYAIGILLQNESEEEREKIYQQISKKYAGTRAEKLAKNIREGIIAY